MKQKTNCVTFAFSLIALLGFATASSGDQGSVRGLVFGPSAAPEATVEITVPSTIQRGNVLDISVSYAQLGVPLNANCIVLLPAPNPPYKETLLFSRKYEVTGVSGHVCPVFIPDFIQIEGTAIVIATVEGVGIGVARVEVTP